jgi:predicted nucleic acid-binding protein
LTFVLDASITVAWCFKDESGQAAAGVLNRLVDGDAVVPSVWPLEVANALLVGERRGRLACADTARFVGLLRELPIVLDVESSGRALSDVLVLAREQALSSYDAAYLELAMRRGSALATLDDGLRQAAARLGIAILEG